MASRKSFLVKPSYIFPETSNAHFDPKSTEDIFELDEADMWNFSTSANPVTEAKKALQPGSRLALKRESRKMDAGGRASPVAAASVPVNIPDWSKILKEESEENRKRESDDDGGIRIPPHEYLARTRGASLSVHEGIGRTLKGRDLRRVRNAIWKKVGFED